MRRAATGWRVIGFAPQRIYPQQGGELMLQIAPEQEKAAVMAMWRAWGFVVKRPALPFTGEAVANPIAPAKTRFPLPPRINPVAIGVLMVKLVGLPLEAAMTSRSGQDCTAPCQPAGAALCWRPMTLNSTSCREQEKKPSAA